MVRFVLSVMAGVLLAGLAVEPTTALGKDDVVGTIWRYRIVRGEKTEKGQFRCYKDELFKGTRKVGEVQPQDDDESTLVFTDFGELNGTITIRKVGRRPPVWKGTLKRPNGAEWSIEIEIKDR